MRSVTRTLVIGNAVLLLTCAAAAADPILLTGGGLVWPSAGVRIDVAGDGFTFSANADASGSGSLGPVDRCGPSTNCRAGGAVPLDSSFDMFGATVTLNGRSFAPVNGADPEAALGGRWSDVAPIPADFTGGLLTAPFQFNGTFTFDLHSATP